MALIVGSEIMHYRTIGLWLASVTAISRSGVYGNQGKEFRSPTGSGEYYAKTAGH